MNTKTKTTKSAKKSKADKTNTLAPVANAVQTANALSAKAVLLKLSTSAFIGNPRDKKLTAEVQADNHTEDNRISVRKKIMQGKELKNVANTLQKVRIMFERLSAPWLDGGIRIVPARRYIETKTTLEKLIRDFNQSVDEFIDSYTDIIARDKIALNGTFNLADYLSPDELRTKFNAAIKPMPVSSDFRVEGIDDAVKQAMQAEVDALTREQVKDAKRAIVSRLAEKIGHLKTKLATSSDNERLHASAISNVAEICDDVLNVLFDDDAQIETTAKEVKDALSKLSIDAIRDNETARKDAVTEVETQLAKVTELMAGFV